MKNKVLILIMFSVFNGYLFSQQNKENTPPANNTEPIDLPNIFIKGDLQLNVNSGSKQDPEKPLKLTYKQLDSLNSLEKLQSITIPIDPLPQNIIKNDFKKGYLRGDFGRFTSALLDAGYNFNISGYNIFANGGLDLSQGDVKNSDYSKIYIKLYSDYIAPEKFFIFGGSRTMTSFKFENNSYKLYALNKNSARTTNNINFNLDVEGKFEETRFETGARFEMMNLDDVDKNISNNNIMGYLKAHHQWNNYYLAGNLILDMNYLRGDAANFYQIDAAASYFDDKFSFNVNGGFQFANNSKNIDRGGLLLAAALEYRMDKLVTIKANIKSGLENNNYSNILKVNQYLSNAADIDFSYDLVNLKSLITYHPNNKIGLSGGIDFRITDRYPIYKFDTNAVFVLDYYQISNFGANLEVFWYMTDYDKLISRLDISSNAISDLSNKVIPYLPSTKLSLDYFRSFNENFGINFGIDYIGERYADIENQLSLDAFINMRTECKYRLNSSLSFSAKFDNLLNQDIIIWQGFQERGLFVSLGAMWQF